MHARPGRRLDRPHERRPAPGRPAAQRRPWERTPRRGRSGMILGRVWDVEGVRSWRLLSRPGIGDHRTSGYFASSGRYLRCSRWAPPVGFEPTHTAPEAASAIHRNRALTCLHAHAAQLRHDVVPRIFRIMKVAPLLSARVSALPPADRAVRRMACTGLATSRCLSGLRPSGIALSKVGGTCGGTDN